ncbi:MAG: putative protease [Oleiphilaceae bacterium]|jgi:putative protease
MEQVIAMKPYALLITDPGLIMMVRERWREIPIHPLVHANTVNWQSI